jgi:hypothetical protein
MVRVLMARNPQASHEPGPWHPRGGSFFPASSENVLGHYAATAGRIGAFFGAPNHIDVTHSTQRLWDGAMAMLEPTTINELDTQRAEDTDRVFRTRTELREVVAATFNVVAATRCLLSEVDATLASSTMMRQPRHADPPLPAHWDDQAVKR